MRRAVLVAVAVTVGIPAALAGSVATAAPRGAHAAAASSQSSLHPSVRAVARQWRATQRRSLRHAGAEIFPGVLNVTLESAGILKGHEADVLDEREVGPSDGTRTLGITARVGATGRALWRVVLAEPKGSGIVVMPERVGPGGKPGVVTVEYSEATDASKTRALGETFRAYSGSDGTLLWHRSYTGTAGPGGAESGVPEFGGALTSPPGAAPGYLVSRQSKAGKRRAAVVDVVSGATGAARTLGVPVTSTAGAPAVTAGPDLNGDGAADVLVLTGGPDGATTALSSTDGSTIWTGDEIESEGFLFAQALPDFSSPTTPDIALSVFDPADLTASANSGFAIDIVDGHTGHLMWTRQGFGVTALHVAGNNLVPAVGIQSFGGGNGASTRSVTAAMTYSAVSVDDTVLYKKRQSLTVRGTSSESASESGFVASIGDVQSDGSVDEQLALTVQSGSAKAGHTKTLTGLIDGRTGTFHPIDFQAPADGSLRHGDATDLLGVHVVAGRPRVTAWRGSTRRRYYRRLVPGVAGIKSAAVSGLRVSGHSCSDIGLTTTGPTTDVVGVLDAAGAPLWTVGFGRTEATGGAVHRFAAPRRDCV